MRKLIRNNKELITWVIWCCITFILIFFHENWRDEAQAWLIARDCSIPELFGAMKYEGHFLLWYIILMPFAKLGFPYITTNIISWLITSISVLLILKKAPFKFYKRVLLIVSFPIMYLFPIVSRCYCLIPLAVVLMCIFYKDRKQKPFRYLISVIMLVNTHVLMLGMAGIVLIDYILEFIRDWKRLKKEERTKILISYIIVIALLILSLLPLIGCLTTNKDVGNDVNIVLKIFNTIFYYPFVIFVQICGVFIADRMIIIILVIALVLLFFEIASNPLDWFKVLVCILWQCIIYSFIFGTALQRASTIIFVLLYFKWIEAYKESKKQPYVKKIVSVCWVILIVINIVQGLLYVWFYEIKSNYSNAYEMGNYINMNMDDNIIVLSGPRIEYITSIIPHVSKNVKYYHIQGNRWFSYAIWDDKNKIELSIENIHNLANIFDKEQKLYYIYCSSKSKIGDDIAQIDERSLINECIEKGIFKEIYSTNKVSVQSESYIMYEILLSNL